jgi:hypothetical protein
LLVIVTPPAPLTAALTPWSALIASTTSWAVTLPPVLVMSTVCGAAPSTVMRIVQVSPVGIV